MKIGIVGGKGFIGRNFCSYLREIGVPLIEFGKLEVSQTPLDQVIPQLSSIDVILWAASNVNPKIANESPEKVSHEFLLWDNFVARIKLFELIVNKSIQIIFLSSGGCVYDGDSPPFEVGDSAQGINHYGKMKLGMESILVNSTDNYTILRVSNAYGSGQPAGRGQGVFAEWNQSLIANEPLKVFGSVKQIRDYINIVDVSKGLFLAAKLKTKGTHNLGYGAGFSLEYVQSLYSKFWDSSLKFEYHPDRVIDRNSYWLNMSKTEEILNWRPQVDLELGIRKMLENL